MFRSYRWAESRGQQHGTGTIHLPFVSGPQQVGAQDDGDVAGGHLVGVTGLRKLREKLDQVPEDERVAAHSERPGTPPPRPAQVEHVTNAQRCFRNRV